MSSHVGHTFCEILHYYNLCLELTCLFYVFLLLIYIYIYFLLESRLAADHLLEGQELERETPGSGEVVNM